MDKLFFFTIWLVVFIIFWMSSDHCQRPWSRLLLRAYSFSTQPHRVNYWKTEETVRKLAYVHCVDTNLKHVCTELKSKIQFFFPNNYSPFWHICVLWIHLSYCTIQLMFHLCWWTENVEQQTSVRCIKLLRTHVHLTIKKIKTLQDYNSEYNQS